jgi:hypothetical protein
MASRILAGQVLNAVIVADDGETGNDFAQDDADSSACEADALGDGSLNERSFRFFDIFAGCHKFFRNPHGFGLIIADNSSI